MTTTLEVFLHPAPLPPDLTRHMETGEPLRPGLPAERLHYPLPNVQDRLLLTDAVQRFAPQVWAGARRRRGGILTVARLLGTDLRA